MTSREDRRIEKSKQALRAALMELIVERGYEHTSVSDIADRANVGRSTFYAHYADKDDLLQDNLQTLRAHLQAQIAAAGPRPDTPPALAFALPMLQHVHDVGDLVRRFMTAPAGVGVGRHLHDLLVEIVRANLPPEAQLPAPPPVVAQSVVGSFLALCTWWVRQRPDLSPEAVDDAFCKLAQHGILGSAGPSR